MRVFISYASEQRDVAERLALGLRNEGDRVFFDRDDLSAGGSFDDRIRRAVGRSHLFVFLVSKASLREGAYTLTELSLAQKRWPRPAGRVLPILVDDLPIASLPPYLRSVSVLQSRGDLVADALEATRRLGKARQMSLGLRFFALGIAVLAMAGVWAWLAVVKNGPFVDSIQITPQDDGAGESNDRFKFAVTFGNAGPDAITLVGMKPHAESDDVSFGGTRSDWVSLNRGESKSVSFVTSLRKNLAESPFRWRLCWDFVRTEDLYTELYPKKMNVDMFMARYRQEACDAWRTWRAEQ